MHNVYIKYTCEYKIHLLYRKIKMREISNKNKLNLEEFSHIME